MFSVFQWHEYDLYFCIFNSYIVAQKNSGPVTTVTIIVIIYLLHPREGCEVLRWVVFVSLSVHSHNSKTTRSNFTNFVHVVAVVAHSSFDVVAIRYVLPFCGWRYVFVLWSQWARIKYTIIFSKSLPGSGTSWASDNYSVFLSSSECGTGGDVCYAIYNFLVHYLIDYTDWLCKDWLDILKMTVIKLFECLVVRDFLKSFSILKSYVQEYSDIFYFHSGMMASDQFLCHPV